MSAMPLLISIEGGEGAGKTTLLDALERRMLDEERVVIRTREPGGTPLGEKLRNLLLEKSFDGLAIAPKAELLLFLAGRAQQLSEVIVPALEEGGIVLCDRFNDSTVAYQGYGRALGGDEVASLCQWACGSITPDLTLYLDLDPKVAFSRLKQRQRDKFEEEDYDFHSRVRIGFQTLARQNPQRIVTIDGAMGPEELFSTAWQLISQRLIRLP